MEKRSSAWHVLSSWNLCLPPPSTFFSPSVSFSSLSFLLPFSVSGNLCLPGARCNISTYILRGYQPTQSLSLSVCLSLSLSLPSSSTSRLSFSSSFDHASPRSSSTSVRDVDLRASSNSRIPPHLSFPLFRSSAAFPLLSLLFLTLNRKDRTSNDRIVDQSLSRERVRNTVLASNTCIFSLSRLLIFLLIPSLTRRCFSCPVRYRVLWQFAVPLLLFGAASLAHSSVRSSNNLASLSSLNFERSNVRRKKMD